MLDAVAFFVGVTFVCVWIDNEEWYINNMIIVCIAIEVAKIFRINKFKLGVKVMIFNLIIDLFWSISSQYVYPHYINLSRNSRYHTSFLKLEIPVFFEER